MSGVVYLVDSDFGEPDVERDLLERAGFELVTSEPADTSSVSGLLLQWTSADREFLDRYDALKVVGRFGLGVDNIDTEHSAHRGIRIVNSGEYATEEVATHAVAMILALARQLLPADRAVRAGHWIGGVEASRLRRASETTVGVAGLGRIGRRTAQMLVALGFNVITYDPYQLGDEFPRTDDFRELLRQSQVLTLHVPATPETVGLIGRPELAELPEHSVLVNVSRGSLVDYEALSHALDSGHVSAAGLDVFSVEPPAVTDRLLERSNVLLSPHMAYLSPASLVQARKQTTEDVIAVLSQAQPVHSR